MTWCSSPLTAKDRGKLLNTRQGALADLVWAAGAHYAAKLMAWCPAHRG